MEDTLAERRLGVHTHSAVHYWNGLETSILPSSRICSVRVLDLKLSFGLGFVEMDTVASSAQAPGKIWAPHWGLSGPAFRILDIETGNSLGPFAPVVTWPQTLLSIYASWGPT